MRLSEQSKAAGLHRLYRVLFWLLLVLAIIAAAVSATAYTRILRFLTESHSSSIALTDAAELYGNILFSSVAVLILLPFLPLLYRLLLYVLHGEAAFRPRAHNPQPRSQQPPRNERSSRSEQTEDRPDPFTVLGVARTATFEEIKQAYRTKMREYHPDKVASLGAELRELAERKAKQINEAFEALSRQHATA